MNDQCDCHLAPAAIHRSSVSICAGESCRAESAGGMPLVGIGRLDAPHQFAGFRIARHNGSMSAQVGQGARFSIQSQLGLPLRGIGPMALKAVIREDRPHIAIEVDLRAAAMRRPDRRRATSRTTLRRIRPRTTPTRSASEGLPGGIP